MVVSVLAAGEFLVKTGTWRHIDLAAYHRFDACRLRRTVEINDAVHDAMIRDGGAVHSQFLHPGDIFLYFIGAVQEGILRVDVKMYECHDISLLLCFLPELPPIRLHRCKKFLQVQYSNSILKSGTLVKISDIIFQKRPVDLRYLFTGPNTGQQSHL